MAKRKPLKDCIVKPGEQFVDTYNYTVVELSKVPFFIDKKSDDLSKWLFFFRFLSRLKKLPAEFSEHKFERLTESSKVSSIEKFRNNGEIAVFSSKKPFWGVFY